MLCADIFLPIGDFLDAADLESLAMLDSLHEVAGLQQAFVRTGVEPGETPTENLYLEFFAFEILVVDVGDFQFAAGRRFEALGDFDDFPVVKIEADDGVVRLGTLWFFLNAEGVAVFVELDEATDLLTLVSDVPKREPVFPDRPLLPMIVATNPMFRQRIQIVFFMTSVSAFCSLMYAPSSAQGSAHCSVPFWEFTVPTS